MSSQGPGGAQRPDPQVLPPTPGDMSGTMSVPLPRVAIEFCVQCKWNLRAAYYCQELLQTFSRSLGEVALIPSTSGTFVVSLWLQQPAATAAAEIEGKKWEGEARKTPWLAPKVSSCVNDDGRAVNKYLLWDRKTDGGFPETKELKRRVRDLVEPGKGLGHVDVNYPKKESRGTGDGGKDKSPDERQDEHGQGGVQEGDRFRGTAEEDGKRDGCEDCTRD